MKPSLRKLALLVLIAAVVGTAAFSLLDRPVRVDVAGAVRGPLRVTVDEDGKTRIKERYTVSAPLPGRLLRIDLDPGDRVEAGKTLIATIEPAVPELLDVRVTTQAKARVKASEASRERAFHSLERARFEHQYATFQRDRMAQAYERKAVSHQDLDSAEERERSASESLKAAQFGLQVAEFELEQARAALLLIESQPNGSTAGQPRFDIRSPVSGSVLRVFRESEGPIPAGEGLVEVGDPSDMEMEIDVLSNDAVRIHPGAKVLIEHWGGDAPLLGRVRLIEPAGFTKISALGVEEQRVNVIVDFVDPPEKRGRLGDRYRVDARIVVSEAEDVLKIPSGALFKAAGEWQVYVVENGRAVQRSVTIERQSDLEAEVIEGLDEKAQLILYPSDRVKNNVAVTPR